MQQLRLECKLPLWRMGSLITQAAQVSGHDKSGEIGIQIGHRQDPAAHHFTGSHVYFEILLLFLPYRKFF